MGFVAFSQQKNCLNAQIRFILFDGEHIEVITRHWPGAEHKIKGSCMHRNSGLEFHFNGFFPFDVDRLCSGGHVVIKNVYVFICAKIFVLRSET